MVTIRSEKFLTDLQAGDLAFGPIGGGVGFGVGLGQIFMAPWKRRLSWKRWWRVRHTGVVVRGPDHRLFLVEAEPGGVKMTAMSQERHWTKDWIYIRPRYTPGQADQVAEIARRQARKRIPYAFETYPALAIHRFGLRPGFLEDWLARVDSDGDPVRVICSWEVDSALTLAGFHPFDDGRLPHDVIPSELYVRLLEMGPDQVLSPAGLNWIPPLTFRQAADVSGRIPVPAYLL